jgi:hypothetical protein
MSYAVTNPPVCLIPSVGGHSAIWVYKSTDIHTTVVGAGYITNADDLGMAVDDIVIVIKTSATVGATLHTVASVTAGGAATLTSAILA